jgi:hypothetical protein
MRYWFLLIAKLFGCLLVWLLLRKLVNRYDWTTLPGVLLLGLMVWVVCGLLFVGLLDQRYRCRVCLRRLRMPVSQGSWAGTIINSAATEYICPFGHGRLSVPEAQLTGDDAGNWKPSKGFWEDLSSSDEEEIGSLRN